MLPFHFIITQHLNNQRPDTLHPLSHPLIIQQQENKKQNFSLNSKYLDVFKQNKRCWFDFMLRWKKKNRTTMKQKMVNLNLDFFKFIFQQNGNFLTLVHFNANHFHSFMVLLYFVLQNIFFSFCFFSIEFISL